MKIRISVIVSLNPTFISKWNAAHRIQYDGCGTNFDLFNDLEEYTLFRQFYEKYKTKGFTGWSEVFYLRFSKKEYLNMDKLFFWPNRQISRNLQDFEQSYSFIKCEKCGEILSKKQIAPLFFRENPFDKDKPDPLDYGALKNNPVVMTGEHEILVNSKIASKLSEAKLTGFSIEKVEFADKSLPDFFNLCIHDEIGDLIYPKIIQPKKVCNVCNSPQNSELPFRKIFNPRNYGRPVVPDKDWRSWSMQFKPGNNSNNDILTTREKDGLSKLKRPFFVISPEFYKVLSDNKVRGFTLCPVSLIRDGS